VKTLETIYIQYKVNSRAISPFSVETKMTLNNETPKRFTQTTDDEIINKRLNFFNITIGQCKFVPKCYTCSNIWCRVTFVKSLNQHFATYLLLFVIVTKKNEYVCLLFQRLLSGRSAPASPCST
jgi:hypothetical protein